MSSIMSSVMMRMDWDVRFAIPECTSQSRALIEELIAEEKQLLQLEQTLEQNKHKKQFQAEDIKSQKQTLESTEALYRTKVREEELKKHLTAVTEREHGRFAQDKLKMENELQLFEERSNMLENRILKTNQKLQGFKNRMNWDQQTTDVFLEESLRKDEDSMAIVKYAQQDEQRIKSLTLAIEKKSLEANKKRKTQNKVLTDKVTTEISLDKTKETLLQSNQETQQLIQQWEFIVKQMKQRDNDMERCALKISEIHRQVGEKKSAITEKKATIDSVLKNKEKTERNLMVTKKQGVKLWQELLECEDYYNCLKDKLRTRKKTLERTTSDMDAAASHSSSVQKENCDKSKKLKTAKVYNVALEDKLKRVTATALSKVEQASQMEQFLQEEEKAMKELEVHLHERREKLFSFKQQLQSLKIKEKNTLVQMSRTKCAMLTLENEQRKIERDLLSRQMNMNQQDAEINCSTIKLERLQGGVNTEKRKILDKNIVELKAALEETEKEAGLQNNMLKEVEEDICRFKKKLEKSEGQRCNLEDKVEEFELQYKASEKELKSLWSQMQDNMVDRNIFKMKVKRMRDLLYNKLNSKMSLEKQRLEFQREMKVRKEEIHVYKERQCQQLNIIEQQRLKLSVELNKRILKIDLMKKRFEVLSFSMAGPEGEEQKSLAYYIIKAAQEKEELKREGNSLDATIYKEECENRALENAILMVSNSSSPFRELLNKYKESTPEFQEKVKLEEQLKEAEATLRHKKIQVKKLQQDLLDMNNTCENLRHPEGLEREKIENKVTLITKINKVVESQEEKIDRSAKECLKLIGKIRSVKRSISESFEEKDIRLKELREFNQSTDKLLIEAMTAPDLRSALRMYFKLANLPLPSLAFTPFKSSRGSRNISGCSSASGKSSTSTSGSGFRFVTIVNLSLDLPVAPPAHTTRRLGSSTGTKCQDFFRDLSRTLIL